MSLEIIKNAFMQLNTCPAWSLQLLRIRNTVRDGTTYSSREINLTPAGTLTSFVEEISAYYVSGEKEVTKYFFNGVVDYNGHTYDRVIYKLHTDNQLIASGYAALLAAIAQPDVELDPLDFQAQAYLLKGIISIDGSETPVKLISMQKPVTTLKHKFAHANGAFKEITDKVLTLRTSIDVFVIGDILYMLSLAGENLFNMERAYKATCLRKLEDIEQCDIVTDFSVFSAIAGSGHNPRKFVSFNDSHLRDLESTENRIKMAQKFDILMDGERFDTSNPEMADKLVRLLCDRGTLDPFDGSPREAVGLKKWE